MKHKQFEFNGASRSTQRAKRRKTNLILNSLIVIVLLLIVIVSYSIFFGGDDKASNPVGGQNTETTDKNNHDKAKEEDSNKQVDKGSNENMPVEDGEETNSESTTDREDSSSDSMTPVEPETNDVVQEGGTDSNVKSTITNPNWQPVGTVQTGEHVTVYDNSSVDWQEMLTAISYGTGLDPSNMTVWFLGRDKQGGANQSVATVSSKDNSINYRVYIQWIDSQGWKPTKIEELHVNDKR
ncbi:YrrS family protein [Pseudoneobacillus sp. C159]